MSPRRAATPLLAIVVAVTMTGTALAGLNGNSHSWRQISPDEQYALIMVSPDPLDKDGSSNLDGPMITEIRDIRSNYTQSGQLEQLRSRSNDLCG